MELMFFYKFLSKEASRINPGVIRDQSLYIITIKDQSLILQNNKLALIFTESLSTPSMLDIILFPLQHIIIYLLGPLKQARGGEQLFFGLRNYEEEIEGLVCTQVLVGTPSSDFSENEIETELIYSGSVLLDLHPLP